MTFDVSTRAEFALVAEVVAALRPHADAHGAELLVVGAVARDLLVTARTGSLPLRATNDVDIALAVDGWAGFRAVTAAFEPVRGAEQRFRIAGVPVDVVPFGGIESDDGTIGWPDGHVMTVLGFAEALTTAEEVLLPGGVAAKVADIPAQVVLKLMAWRDRGMRDGRDAVDLLTLLQAFAEGTYLERLYDRHAGSLARHAFDVALAAADAVGCLAAAAMGPSALHAVTELLDRECGDEGTLPARMGVMVARNRDLLAALAEGLRHPG